MNTQEKMPHCSWSGPIEIYLHWSCLLIALLDGTSHFLLSLFILCSFSAEIITPLFLFILILSLVKMLFVSWVSISSSCCLFFSVGLTFFWTVTRTKFVFLFFFSTWIRFLESMDASFWIWTNLFTNRLLLFWIFSNLSSCDCLSSFNFLICSSSSWLRFLRRWLSSCCFSILPQGFHWQVASSNYLFVSWFS